MNGLPYYKAYPRDFIEGTIGMPFELKGAYRLVLDLIYMQGGRLPDDPRYISGLLGCSVRKWTSFRNDLVAMGKLHVSGECLTNYRAIIELETLRKLQDKQRENASGPRKNKELEKPRLNHTESEPDKKKEHPKGCSKERRGTRLPDDWTLPDAWKDWALSQQWPEASIRLEADKFADFWRSKSGKDATKLDWQATWRNWMRNSKAPRLIDGRGPPAVGYATKAMELLRQRREQQ